VLFRSRHSSCGFRRTGKAMGKVYQCWWRICREINFFFPPDSNTRCFKFYIRLWPIYWLSLVHIPENISLHSYSYPINGLQFDSRQEYRIFLLNTLSIVSSYGGKVVRRKNAHRFPRPVCLAATNGLRVTLTNRSRHPIYIRPVFRLSLLTFFISSSSRRGVSNVGELEEQEEGLKPDHRCSFFPRLHWSFWARYFLSLVQTELAVSVTPLLLSAPPPA
jgi:hypothetical protein